MKFCLCDLENKIILKGPMNLPHVFKDEVGETTVFHSLSLEQLKARNWLPVSNIDVEIDSVNQVVESENSDVQENEVVITQIVRLKTEAEKHQDQVDTYRNTLAGHEITMPPAIREIRTELFELYECVSRMREVILTLSPGADIPPVPIPDQAIITEFNEVMNLIQDNPDLIERADAIEDKNVWQRVYAYFRIYKGVW